MSAIGSVAHDSRRRLWRNFCDANCIVSNGVQLFSLSPNGYVEVMRYGRNARPILKRSAEMQSLIQNTVAAIIAAPQGQVDGLLYMMYRIENNADVIPLYIGKAERRGRSGTKLSANLSSIETDNGKFARWGYNYAYHMGDLSAVALLGHPAEKRLNKYERWAKCLFEVAPSESPMPRFDVRFWCCSWGVTSTGIWPEIGTCPLAFSEYLVIGIAGLLFPEQLLNDEGVNRIVHSF